MADGPRLACRRESLESRMALVEGEAFPGEREGSSIWLEAVGPNSCLKSTRQGCLSPRVFLGAPDKRKGVLMSPCPEMAWEATLDTHATEVVARGGLWALMDTHTHIHTQAL